MSINEATYEQLERWLRGELNAEEAAAFEVTLAQNPELLAEAEWLSSAQEIMHDEGRAALKKLIGGIGASIPLAALATYQPSINAIPKWKVWLKKFWWLPVSVLAAGSLVAVLTTANDIVHEKQFDPSPQEQKKENVDTASEYNKPVDSSAKEGSEANKAGQKPPAVVNDQHYQTTEQQKQNFFVEDRYQALVASLLKDSGYTAPQLLDALKRRNIKTYDSQPKEIGIEKKK